MHHGPHDDIDVTYGRLGMWVVEHALAVNGPIYESYLVGHRDDPEPHAWRTEIGWPIFRLAPSDRTVRPPGSPPRFTPRHIRQPARLSKPDQV